MTAPIAIVVLTKDEPEFLDKTIRSIINRTNYSYELFIVDNNSSLDKQKKLLKSYEKDGLAHVIFNNKNQWVLGFNKAIGIINTRADLSSDYIVLTDGDIVVPNLVNEVCWLTYLKQKMDGNVTVGKLGLALNTQFIKNNNQFSDAYANELRYMKGPVMDDLVIAPVDTTLAIYRKDLFVMNQFRMLPGHGSLIRPYYYVCRANGMYLAEHLGWHNYIEPNINQLKEKVLCFAKYAGYVDPIILDQVGSRVKYSYKIFGRIYKAYWSLRVVWYWVRYIVVRFPRNLNEIQSKLR
jgi:glycosyltransferase involved in cell wall biosynthesis